MTLTHRMASPTKDTGFPSQELLVAKLELVSVMRHSASSLPPLLVIAVSLKTIVRNSQINPLCPWVVLGRVLEIETHRNHPEEVAQHLETFRHRHKRLHGVSMSFWEPSPYLWLHFYNTHSPHWPLNPEPHMSFLLLHLNNSLQPQSP